MTYLVDSDVVIDCLNGVQVAVRRLSQLRDDGLSISLISVGEVYEGIYFGRRPEEQEQAFIELLEGFTVLYITGAIMKRFARIRGELRRAGQRIEDMDILIAATAIENGLTLVTRNVAHFQRIPNLALYQPS